MSVTNTLQRKNSSWRVH